MRKLGVEITLDETAAEPIYRQLCDALRREILSGGLKPGQLMPSSRQMAECLKVARLTVIRSYEELLSQGYLTASMGKGTFVAHNLAPLQPASPKQAEPTDDAASPVRLSAYGWQLLQSDGTDYKSTIFPQLNYGAAPPDCLPIKEWRMLLQRHSRLESASEIDYDTEPFGFPPLRTEIASLLKRRRGIVCDPDQVVLFGGAQHALNMIARVLVDAESAVAIEESGYSDIRQALLAQKARLYPMPVDDSGLVVRALNEAPDDLRLIFVTPSHHNPSGVALTPDRRKALLDFAVKANTFIVEDDYDNEYRYAGVPAPALHSLDKHDTVIYFSSFWRVLFPLVSVHFCVIPLRLIPVFERAKLLSQRTFAMTEQYVLTDFIKEGHLEKHLRRTRAVYAKRRQLLIKALTECFRQEVSISKSSAGMHLTVSFQKSSHPQLDEVIERSALQAGLPLANTRSFYLQTERDGEFLIGFAGMKDESIEPAVRSFAQLVLEAHQD